jgi:hypothetical protein
MTNKYIYFSFFIICQQNSYMLPQVSFIFYVLMCHQNILWRKTDLHIYMNEWQIHIKSNVHISFLIQHVPQQLDAKKYKQINVKSRNDAKRLPSQTKPRIRHCNIQLILSLRRLQILRLLGQNTSSTSFHINYCSFYL